MLTTEIDTCRCLHLISTLTMSHRRRPKIMAALARVNSGPAQPYGQDPETKAMKIAFSDLFGKEVWVMPVSTGTAANAIALRP